MSDYQDDNLADWPSIRLPDIRREFSAKTYKRAVDIVDSGAVRSLDWIENCEEDAQVLVGLVQGSANTPYAVSVLYRDDEFLGSHCSCPVGYECKHAAACLIATYRLTTGRTDTPTGATTGATTSATTSAAIRRWMDRLVATQVPPGAKRAGWDDPADVGLVYDLVPDGEVGRDSPTTPVWLTVYASRIGKNGLLTKGRRFRIDRFNTFYARELALGDEQIVDLVRMMVVHASAQPLYDLPDAYRLTGQLGHLVLERLLESGRLYLDGDRQTPVARGVPRTLSLGWEPRREDGLLAPVARVDGLDRWRLFQTDPPWYLDVAGNAIGPLKTTLSGAAVAAVLAAPPMAASDAQSVANELSVKLPAGRLPLPATPAVDILDDALSPEIRIFSIGDSPDIADWVVACTMRYGDHALPFDLQRRNPVQRIRDSRKHETVLTRDLEREYQSYRDFQQILHDFEPCMARDTRRFTLGDHQPVRRDPAGRLHAFERLFSVIPRLEAAGFEVEIEPSVSVEIATVETLSLLLDDTGGGWFELGLALEHGGHRYELLPLVLDWLQRTGGNAPLRWQGLDGHWLEAPEAMLKPVMETLGELLDERDPNAPVTLPRARALVLPRLREELAAAGIETWWQGADGVFALADRLRAFSEVHAQRQALPDAPAGLDAELRHYQLQGMAWLGALASAGLNGILADDMGLGKTVQTLAHVQSLVNDTARKHRKNRHGPFLIVAPTSLLGNWAREAVRFTPGLTVRVWHGGDRHEIPLEDETATIVITSYALALRDHDRLSAHGFTHLILDEAQAIRNPLAKITQSLKRLPIENRLCLTGTPLENHLGELWSQFDFLMPGLLGSREQFTRHFRTPIEKQGSSERQLRLNAVVQPLMLRRRKEQVATELPAKTEIVREVSFGPAQAKLYESIRIAMHSRVKSLLEQRGLARSHIEMLDALLKLRQTCCHPALVKVASAKKVTESAKTDMAIEMIEELVDEGRKILLFSQFTEMLALLEAELGKRGVDYVKLTGRTRKRDEVIDAFQNGDVPLFLISLKAGGTGLNLTAADTVIHYDPWWNPAVERQATDRAHRIGQDKPVFVYKLVTTGTVEEKIVALQARKQQLADATVERDAEALMKGLSVEDVLGLFEG